MRRTLLAVTAALLIPGLAAAQDSDTKLASGTTIRVTAPQALPQRTSGRFQAARGDTLWMEAGRTPQLAVPVSTIERLEIEKGRPRLKWALIGGASGVLAGFILGGMAGGGGDDALSGLGAAAGATAGAAQGLVIGAIGGALLAPRRWIDYPVTGIR